MPERTNEIFLRFPQSIQTNVGIEVSNVPWTRPSNFVVGTTEDFVYVTLHRYIQGIPGSNFGWVTHYSDWGYTWFSSVTPGQCRCNIAKYVTTTVFHIIYAFHSRLFSYQTWRYPSTHIRTHTRSAFYMPVCTKYHSIHEKVKLETRTAHNSSL